MNGDGASAAPARPVAIGIDAGGTHTRGVAVGPDGALLARVLRAAANPRTVGAEAGRAEIAATVAELRAAAPGPVAQLVLGSAGLMDPAPAEEANAVARELGVAAATVDSDARIAHAAAFGTGAGIVVVAGTGSQCLALGTDGARVRVGGWGPAFGDEGSAYWIAAHAIRRAVQALDEERPHAFASALLDFAGIDPEGPRRERNAALLDVLYAADAGPGAHARFAPHVARLAEAGDADAEALLVRAGRALARAAGLAARRSDARAVACVGSVLDRNHIVRGAFMVAARKAGLATVERRWEPVFGAAYLAMAAAGWDAEGAGRAWSEPGRVEVGLDG